MAQETETKHPFDIFCSAFGREWKHGLNLQVRLHGKVTANVIFWREGTFDAMSIVVARPPISNLIERMTVTAVPGRGITLLQADMAPRAKPLVGADWADLSTRFGMFNMGYCRSLMQHAAGQRLLGGNPMLVEAA